MDIGLSNNNVSFYGYKSKFSQMLDCSLRNKRYFEANKNRLLDSITHKFSTIKCSDKELGSGYYSVVHKIDDSYVLKSNRRCKTTNVSSLSDIILKRPIFKKLKRYFGEPVVTLINDSGYNLEILRNVYSKGKTIPAGVPDNMLKRASDSQIFEYYRNVYLPTFSSLPQWSFDGIAHDCAELNKISKKGSVYIFDYLNPNNFVLAGKTIRIIDNVENARMKSQRNSVSDLLNVFVSNIDLGLVEKYSPEIIKHRKLLTKKIILAGIKNKLPINGTTNYDMWIENISLLDLDISNKDIIEMAKHLDNIVKHNKDSKKRVKIASQYLDNILFQN